MIFSTILVLSEAILFSSTIGQDIPIGIFNQWIYKNPPVYFTWSNTAEMSYTIDQYVTGSTIVKTWYGGESNFRWEHDIFFDFNHLSKPIIKWSNYISNPLVDPDYYQMKWTCGGQVGGKMFSFGGETLSGAEITTVREITNCKGRVYW